MEVQVEWLRAAWSQTQALLTAPRNWLVWAHERVSFDWLSTAWSQATDVIAKGAGQLSGFIRSGIGTLFGKKDRDQHQHQNTDLYEKFLATLPNELMTGVENTLPRWILFWTKVTDFLKDKIALAMLPIKSIGHDIPGLQGVSVSETDSKLATLLRSLSQTARQPEPTSIPIGLRRLVGQASLPPLAHPVHPSMPPPPPFVSEAGGTIEKQQRSSNGHAPIQNQIEVHIAQINIHVTNGDVQGIARDLEGSLVEQLHNLVEDFDHRVDR